MTNFTPKQQKVFDTAKSRLEKESWYNGVCYDNFPTDQEIDKDFEGSVTSVVMETEWWDAWDDEGFIPLRRALEEEKKKRIIADLVSKKKISQE